MLLAQFRRTFEGQAYLHRKSTTGDRIAEYLYDDLVTLNRSPKLVARVMNGQVVVNSRNRVTGRVGRRGDGTFGERVPTVNPTPVQGYVVKRGAVANVEIGTEVKTLATKMVAQVDRVMTDLENQAEIFRALNPRAIRVALVGVNHAENYTGYEGTRVHPAKIPPSREAVEIIRRLEHRVRPRFDELIVLRFSATNSEPFPLGV